MFRDQQVAFKLAREICVRWQADNGAAAVPVQRAVSRRLPLPPNASLPKSWTGRATASPATCCLVGEYMQAAIGSLLEAIKKGASRRMREVAVIPQGAAGRGSTLYVDFHTTKPIYPVNTVPSQRDGRRHTEMGAKRGLPAR